MTVSKGDRAFIAGLLVIALAFLPKLAFGNYVDEKIFLAIGGVSKLASLIVGAIASERAARSFASKSATRIGWRAVATWFACWSVAQGVLDVYELFLGESSPFPSPGDAFFVAGYVAMIAGFFVIAWAFAKTGLVGRARGHILTAVIATAPFGFLASLVLTPVLLEPKSLPLEVALNVAYPAFDVVTLLPVLVLARIAWLMRGSAMFQVWATMSLGIVLMVAGDLMYGWFSTLKITALDPLLDLSFIAGYALAARAAVQQLRVVR